MESFQKVFELEANRVVLDFAHGLIFFLAGFAVLLKTKRWSELTLATGLPYLGVFGILNAFGDWGRVFVPVQRAVFSEDVISALWVLDAALLALSYTFLLLFGAQLVAGKYQDRLPQVRHLARVIWGIYALWLVAFVAALFYGMVDPRRDLETLRPFEIAYRYGLALTGSLLSAWGLLLQERELRRLNLEESVPPLKWVGYALLLHALASGLFVPEAGFPPASVINEETLFQLTGIPGRVWTGISGMIVAVFIVVSLDVFDAELGRRIEETRRIRAVLQERIRIARDLHDGIIQTLYALGLHLERTLLGLGDSQAEVKGEIRRVMGVTNHAIQDVREYIGQLKRQEETVDFGEQLTLLVRQLREEAAVPIHLKVDGADHLGLSGGAISDLLFIVREATSNALRHAHASHIEIEVERSGDELRLVVADDGIGFDPKEVPNVDPGGHQGLKNMKQRVMEHSGTLQVQTASGQGTQVVVNLPVSDGN